MTWHFTITSEMRELGLKGNELMVYAIVNGYSANRQGCYYGSIEYICQLTGLSYKTAQTILRSLTERGLLRKVHQWDGGKNRTCFYEVEMSVKITDTEEVCRQNLPSMSVKIADNNKYNNNPPVVYISPNGDNNTTTPQGVSRPKFSKIEQMFLACGAKEEDLRDWKTARKGAPITKAVFNGMEREARKANIDIAQAVRICAENSWRGFRAAYLEGKKGSTPQQGGRTYMGDIKATYAKLQARWDKMGGQQQ